MKNLRKESIHAVKWSSINQAIRLFLRFGFAVVMARLLSPRDFGLMAMIFVITDFSYMFISGGLANALIQKKTLNREDYSTVFYINIVLGFLFTLFFWHGASFLAKFYDEPKLKALTQAVSVIYFINSLSVVQRAVLTRKIAFKKLTIVELGGVLFSGVSGISFAIYGLGVWSLVWAHIFGESITLLLFWLLSPWRPSLIFRLSSMKKLFSYSSKILLSTIIHAVTNKFDIMLVGKLFPAELLGLYSKARANSGLPRNFIAQISSRSFFPILSKLQDDKDRFKSAYCRILSMVVFLGLPLFIFLILTAKNLVGLIFGDKWLGMVGYFQLFCVIGILDIINLLKMYSLNALGRPDLVLKLSSILYPARLLTLLVVALSISSLEPSVYILIITLFLILSNFFFTNSLGKLISLNYTEELALIGKETLSAVGIALLCYGSLSTVSLNAITELSITFVFYFGLYLYIAYVFNFAGLRLALHVLKKKELGLPGFFHNRHSETSFQHPWTGRSK